MTAADAVIHFSPRPAIPWLPDLFHPTVGFRGPSYPEHPCSVLREMVDGGYLALLGVSPQLGRSFSER